jgi:transcriptional accessory protein Tex/SPT6
LKKLYSDTTKETVSFILESYNDIWKDRRVNSASVVANKKITINDVSVWDILDWVVRNVLAFWVFVDIWLKNDWLVHISEIINRFIKDPKEEVEVWQKVKVKVLNIDTTTGKLQLSMKQV